MGKYCGQRIASVIHIFSILNAIPMLPNHDEIVIAAFEAVNDAENKCTDSIIAYRTHRASENVDTNQQ